MKAHRPTLQQIADQAGMSRSGVSRALRNHPGIPASTRERVKKIARELGYYPNPMISALMASLRGNVEADGSSVIAYLTGHSPRETWMRLPATRQNFIGARHRASELGFRLEEFSVAEPGMTGERITRILHTRTIRGLILAPMASPDFELSLDWNLFAVSAIGYTVAREGLHRVRTNHFQGMTLALQQLKALGYRRPGLFLTENLDLRVSHRWAAAFVYFQQSELKAPQRVPMMLEGIEMERAAFHDWFSCHRPDVVLSLGDLPYDWLREANFRIPEDVGYATLSHPGGTSPLSGVNQQSQGVGALAVDLVSEQLYRNEFGLHRQPKIVVIDGKWVPGETVRRVEPVRVAQRNAARRPCGG